ncbi:MAG: IS110 family RNA-guided transposase [Planctomycetota bacterium]|jgi:transposase
MTTKETASSVKHFAGFDLHCDNAVGVIIDESKKCVFKRRFKNDLGEILRALEKYRASLSGIVVESTYNWYWLVDGFMDEGYKVHLAHTVETGKRRNRKYSDDYRDAFHLADLLRKGELPEGYIYPKQERPLRDLLRKRGLLVRSRTQHLLSLMNLVNRQLGIQWKTNDLKSLTTDELDGMFPDERVCLSADSNVAVIKVLTLQIDRLEKAILKEAKLKKEFQVLLTVPGIGDIIGLSIALEVGDIHRFEKPGEYVSYCRCAPSKWTTNDKEKGAGNRKNGNKYLKWAYIEAANFTIRHCPYAKLYYQKKLNKLRQKAGRTITLNAVAAKLARAHYYMLKNGVTYDAQRLFNSKSATRKLKIRKIKTNKGCGSKPKRGLDGAMTEKPTA